MGGKRANGDRGTELSRSLRELRKRAGLSQTDVVDAVEGLSQAELSRTENARSIPNPDTLLPRILTVLQATSEESDRLISMAQATRRQLVPARTILERGTAHFQQRIRDIEDQSEQVRSFHPTTVLGVLQTEAFARAVFSGHVAEDELTRSVAQRLSRHRALLDGSDRRWVLLQTEGALRWNFAGSTVMAEQIAHIAELSRTNDNVQVGVIPWAAETGVQILHGFHIYDFPDRRHRRDPRMVQVGTHSGTTLLGEQDSGRYVELFARLERVAVFDDEARALLTEIASDYRSL